MKITSTCPFKNTDEKENEKSNGYYKALCVTRERKNAKNMRQISEPAWTTVLKIIKGPIWHFWSLC